MRTIPAGSLVAVLWLLAGPVGAITLDAFGPNGAGGSLNGQSLSVGPGGDVFQLDAYLRVGAAPTVQLSTGSLSPGLSLEFDAALSVDSTDLTLSYALSNGTGSALQDLVFFIFVDAEIDEPANTFFNEYAEGAGVLGPGEGFEVDEPGFQSGNILANIAAGALDGTNAVPIGSPDDVSMALSFAIDSLAGDERLLVDVLLSEDLGTLGSFALTQRDADPASPTTITLSGQAQRVPEPAAWLLLIAAGAGLGSRPGRLLKPRGAAPAPGPRAACARPPG